MPAVRIAGEFTAASASVATTLASAAVVYQDLTAELRPGHWSRVSPSPLRLDRCGGCIVGKPLNRLDKSVDGGHGVSQQGTLTGREGG